jgi:hypothetical protein
MGQRNKKYIYVIILTNHGKQLKTICNAKTDEQIHKKLDKLLKENKKVIFPMQFNNHKHVMVEAQYELVIIKCKQDDDSEINKVRNQYGEFVDYKTNNEDWIVIDRVDYNIEETFWVYGYHPKIQRKTYEWIFDNMIAKDGKNKYEFKTIQVYNNKILIENNGKLDMVICKDKKDSVRFYNLTEELCKKKKLKCILFMGDIRKSKHKSQWIQKIKDLTGWNSQKIKRTSTRD